MSDRGFGVAAPHEGGGAAGPFTVGPAFTDCFLEFPADVMDSERQIGLNYVLWECVVNA